MRYFLVTLLLLVGCSTTVPVKQKFPNATPELMKQCEALRKIEGDRVSITEMLKTVVNNYALYHECSAKVDGWHDWYKSQKEIFENTK